MTILSAYNTTNKVHVGDLFSMFTMVPYGLWIGYFVSFLIFFAVTRMGAKILRQRYSSFWMTTCAFLDQDNFPTDSLFITVLSFVVMLGMFFMMNYAGNCMSTDLITIENPIVIKTYNDIINKKIVTAFTAASPEYGIFAQANPETKEGQLFANKVEFTPGPQDSPKFASIAYNQNGVIVIRRPVAEAVGMFYLWYFANVEKQFNTPNIRFYVGADEEYSKRYNNVFVISGKLRNTEKYRAMNGW